MGRVCISYMTLVKTARDLNPVMCFTNLIIHLAQVLLSLVIPYLKILVGVKLVNTSGYDGIRGNK